MRSYGSHICGASIISKNWALTAAQCVDGWININTIFNWIPTYINCFYHSVKNISSITLLAASNTLNGTGHIHEAAKIVSHPGYDIVYKVNDLALIKVSLQIKIVLEYPIY